MQTRSGSGCCGGQRGGPEAGRGRWEACKVGSVVVATRRNVGEEVGSGMLRLCGDPTVPVVVN